MFKSAVLKLTLMYMAIIMAICIFFSITILSLSTMELENTLMLQQKFFERGPGFRVRAQDPTVLENREIALESGYNNLMNRLIYINLGILALAGGTSYLLARKTLKPLEESHERQSRFVSDASHELRSPLAAMQAEIEVTLRDKNLDKKEALAVLASNKEEVEKMSLLVSGLLELAKDRYEKIEIQELSLGKLVGSSLKTMAKPIKVKSLKITNNIASELKVNGNATLLTQLFTILLDNAVKYSPEGGEIELKATSSAKDISLTIIDQGVGISNEDLHHIFDRFYRADTSRTKNQTDGYGLGLSIAEKIVTIHGGKIKAVSEVGKGSIFTIFLPS